MKFKFEIEINAPYLLVIELMGDRESLVHWQPELTDYHLIRGEPGHVGTESRLTYNVNGRPLEVTEVITMRNPPHEFGAAYRTSGLVNHVINRFAETGPESTYWQYESNIEFTNLVMKLVGMFMANAFRDQSWRYMNLFKRFAEEEHRRRQGKT